MLEVGVSNCQHQSMSSAPPLVSTRHLSSRRVRIGFVIALVGLVAVACTYGSSPSASSASQPSLPSSSPSISPSESPSPSPSPSPSASPTTPPVALCSKANSQVTLLSQEGAAGTVRSVWKAKNVSDQQCTSYAYPGMDFHVSSGWLALHVQRGGFGDINGTPHRLYLQPGQSMYYVSYWSQADTAAGPCQPFDRLKVTLPNNFVSFVLTEAGCLSRSEPVDVGPVTKTAPSP
jgi:Domain of unknown function (DUF4232)